ncbi:MAG: TonB-dependent receptor, partial [Bacteroidota bacterium]
TEKIQQNEEVTVTGKRENAINEMSVVSTTTFSMEETQKFAGAMNDPARMATSFAGVANTAGFNNDISVRGNSPRGLVWRMEGVEIPNPNHFSNAGTSGGGISIISAQLMGTSDFSTGAFAAEYGNALSGIFDLGLRKGNNERFEFTLQTSVIGMDAAIEGPIKKGYGGSFLINYRYSTLALMTKVIPFRDNVTKFQDLSFNCHFPAGKAGSFGIFGLGGLSSDTYDSVRDTLSWVTEPEGQYKGVFTANTGIIGAWHKIRIGKQAYLRSNVALSGTNNGYYNDSLDILFNPNRLYNESFLQSRFTFSSNFVQKISGKTNFRAGANFNLIGFHFALQNRVGGSLEDRINSLGSTETFQGYLQLGHRFNEHLSLNFGAHYLRLLLNATQNIEPRVSLAYKLNGRNALAIAYGLHSQIQPLGTYFALSKDMNGISSAPNKGLELSKAHHGVLSYSFVINENHRVKMEAYFQHLFNVPVGLSEDSTFSLLNSPQGFDTVQLNSHGFGRNCGLEFTFERSIYKELYYLITISLFDSKYKAMNSNWYNTRYNTNYIINFTGGKDWVFDNNGKRRTLTAGIKATLMGGMRYTPYDLDQLVSSGYPVLDHSRSFEEQMPPFFRTDIRIGLKRDYREMTGTIYADLLNAFNIQNPAGQYFDQKTGEVKYFYHFGILPVFGYRLTF